MSVGRWAAWLCLLVVAASAQSYEIDLPIPARVGVRAVGMGEAYAAIAARADGVFHNPAGLGVGRGVHLFGQTNLRPRDELKFDPKGIAYRWRGWGVAWGNKIGSHEAGVVDYTYWSIGRRVSSRVAVGVSTKWWRTHPSRHFQVFGNSPTVDLGLLVAPTGEWRFGARVGQVRRGGGVGSFVVAVARPVRRALIAVETAWRDDVGWRLRAGIERRIGTHLSLRAGWRDGHPTVGIGGALSGLRLDAAWTRVGGLGVVFIGAEIGVGERYSWTQ